MSRANLLLLAKIDDSKKPDPPSSLDDHCCQFKKFWNLSQRQAVNVVDIKNCISSLGRQGDLPKRLGNKRVITTLLKQLPIVINFAVAIFAACYLLVKNYTWM